MNRAIGSAATITDQIQTHISSTLNTNSIVQIIISGTSYTANIICDCIFSAYTTTKAEIMIIGSNNVICTYQCYVFILSINTQINIT